MEIKNTSGDSERIENLISTQVLQLRKILKEKHNVIVPAHCNDLIARCIRMKDENLESALKLLKLYHTATGDFCTWDAAFKPSVDIDGYNAGKLMVIKQKDPDGRFIFIIRVGMWEPDTMPFDHAIACIWMLLQYITAVSKDAQRDGIVTIFDFTKCTMKHVWGMNKWRVPQIVKIVQSGLSGRLKEFHLINHSNFVSLSYSTIVKPFLKNKLKKRITFHDNLETLHERFDRNGLPTFAGGSQTIEECMDWKLMNEFLNQDQYFIDMMNDRFPRY